MSNRTDAPSRRLPALSRRPRVLVVEDCVLNRLVAEDALAAADYEVDSVGGGREAVAAMRRADFDVVLMDLELPDIDGIAAVRQIRQMGGKKTFVSILAVSAHAMEKDVARCLANGMDGHVAKPYSISQLLGAVSGCLAAGERAAA